MLRQFGFSMWKKIGWAEWNQGSKVRQPEKRACSEPCEGHVSSSGPISPPHVMTFPELSPTEASARPLGREGWIKFPGTPLESNVEDKQKAAILMQQGVGGHPGSGQAPRSEPQFHRLQTGTCGKLTSWGLGLLICKMGMLMMRLLWGVNNASKRSSQCLVRDRRSTKCCLGRWWRRGRIRGARCGYQGRPLPSLGRWSRDGLGSRS